MTMTTAMKAARTCSSRIYAAVSAQSVLRSRRGGQLSAARALSSVARRLEGEGSAGNNEGAAAACMLLLGSMAMGSSIVTHMEGAEASGTAADISQRQQMLATAPWGALFKTSKKLPSPDTVTSVPHRDVTIWQKDGRTIFLLGALNYAATSADLAGMLVKEINPDAVFLDINKKVFTEFGIAERVERRLEVKEGKSAKFWRNLAELPEPIEELPEIVDTTGSKKAGMLARLDEDNPVEKSITGIFGQLRFAGLKKSDERVASWTHYVSAVESAQRVKADIVLGGRDDAIAQSRREEAMSKTDSKAAADLVFAIRPNWKTKLTPRENLTTIRTLMEQDIPSFSQVVFAETDEHNALNLDKMWQKSIVAVFMMIHISGVEKELKAKGWKQVHTW